MDGEHLAGRGSGRRLGRRAERMERAVKAVGVREEKRRRGEKGRRGRGEEEAEGPMVLNEAADWLWPPEEEEERLVCTVTDTFLFMTLR